jgi:hypothetical protein
MDVDRFCCVQVAMGGQHVHCPNHQTLTQSMCAGVCRSDDCCVQCALIVGDMSYIEMAISATPYCESGGVAFDKLTKAGRLIRVRNVMQAPMCDLTTH